MIQGQRGYHARHRNVMTAQRAGNPLANDLSRRALEQRAEISLTPAAQAAIAIAVAAEYCDDKTVAEHCARWAVRTEWYERELIACRKTTRLRIICERAGEVTGVYEPLAKLAMLQQIAESIATNGGTS